MEVKFCPICGKLDDPKKAVCDCGYVPENGPRKGKTRDRLPAGDDLPLRFNRRRIFVLAFAVILSSAAVFAFFNLDGATADADDGSPRTEPAADPDSRANLAGGPAVRAFEGLVTRVITGEVLVVRDNANAEYQVRLFGIVAPKLNDALGMESKEVLSEQVLGRSVRVVPVKTEEGGVVYGHVTTDERNIGLEQVRNGFAKHDLLSDQPEEESKLYAEAEEHARNARSGIWNDTGTSAAASSEGGPDPARDPARRPGPPAPAVIISEGSPTIPAPEPAMIQNGPPPKSEESKPLSTPAAELPKELPPIQVAPPPAATPEARQQPAEPAAAATERKYVRGPRGGCYFINAKGSKSYVDHSRCQ